MPVKRAGTTGRSAVHFDERHSALLEFNAAASAEQARRELAEVGFVSDQREAAMPLGVLLDGLDHGLRAAARRQRLDFNHGRLGLEARSQDHRGVAGTYERAS